MARLTVPPLLLCVMLGLGGGSAAQAQDYLSQSEMVAILQSNAMCYDADTTGACTWAESYHLLDGPRIGMRIGVMSDAAEMLVIEQEATWIGDGMCIRDGDLGILRTYAASGPQMFFDYRGQVPQGDDVLADTIAAVGEGLLSKTCFQFIRDATSLAGLVQHIFADGARQEGETSIRLIPLSQGFAPLRIP